MSTQFLNKYVSYKHRFEVTCNRIIDYRRSTTPVKFSENFSSDAFTVRNIKEHAENVHISKDTESLDMKWDESLTGVDLCLQNELW